MIYAFITAMGGPLWFIWLVLGYVSVEALRIATTIWLSFWTGQTDSSTDGGSSAMYYLVSEKGGVRNALSED